MRRSIATLVAASSLAALPQTAQAAPAWVASADLAAEATSPAVGAGVHGDVAVAWVRAGVLEVRFRTPGGSFGPTEQIAPAVTSADATTTPDGTGVLTWSQADGVYLAIHPSGGTTSSPVRIAEATDAGGVRIAVSPRGDLLVTYGAGDAAYAVYRTAGLAFDPPVGPFPASTDCDVVGAVGAAGDAVVGWRASCANASSAVVVRRPAGGSFGTAETLGSTDALDLAVSGDGGTAVLRHSGVNVTADVAPRGGGFVQGQQLGDGAPNPGRIAAAPDGFAAAWVGATRVQVRRLGGSAGAVALSEPGARAPRLGVAGDGSITVAWLRTDALEAAKVAPDGTVATAAPAPAPGAEALELAVDTDGNAYAAAAKGGTLTGAALDAAGPRLDQLFVPLDGYAEEPVGLSMNPLDAWSEVAGTSFDLGDGTRVDGRSATHVYDTAGTRSIVATAADSLGNTTVVRRDLEIAPKRDRTAPKITRLRMDDRRFRVARKVTPVELASAAKAAPKGTKFRYTVSEAGHSSIFFERRARKENGRRYYKAVGLIVRRHKAAGKVKVGFTGRIVAKKGRIRVADVRLTPGAYRASVVAADAARNKSKPARIRFKIVR